MYFSFWGYDTYYLDGGINIVSSLFFLLPSFSLSTLLYSTLFEFVSYPHAPVPLFPHSHGRA